MIVKKSNPCDRCPALPFIVPRGGAQGEIQKGYNDWELKRPVVRRRPFGRIDAELRYLVGRPPRGWVELFLSGRLAFPR
jgi:hypothetical protein